MFTHFHLTALGCQFFFSALLHGILAYSCLLRTFPFSSLQNPLSKGNLLQYITKNQLAERFKRPRAKYRAASVVRFKHILSCKWKVDEKFEGVLFSTKIIWSRRRLWGDQIKNTFAVKPHRSTVTKMSIENVWPSIMKLFVEAPIEPIETNTSLSYNLYINLLHHHW